MKKILTMVVVGLSFFLAGSVAFAVDTPAAAEAQTPKINGLYAGGGFLQSFIDQGGADYAYDGGGVDIYLGYKSQVASSLYVGVEFENSYLGQFTDADNNAFSMFSFNLVGEYVINQRISLMAKAGSVNEDIQDGNIDLSSQTNVLLGSAIQYHWKTHWSTYLNYEHIFGDNLAGALVSINTIATNIVGLGVQYTF